MATRVLVTGAGGQLGRELAEGAPVEVECTALSRADLDIADGKAVAATLAELKPDTIINAAAYTAVDDAETEPELARRGNAEGPALLARHCADRDIRLIHVSTDFVFSGDASTPYETSADTAPLGEYGRSKLAGEIVVRKTLPAALIIRTGWVYSHHGGNFVKTMLRLMKERDELGVVADQVGTPTWARGLADACWSAVERPQLQGLLHWSDAGVCSWYDFAVAIYEEASALGLLLQQAVIKPITTADYPTPAARPAYSVLDKSDSWAALELEGVHWRRQLRAMLQELRSV